MKKSIDETTDAPLTKAGLPRKKRLFKLSVKERTEKKTKLQQLKHKVKPACNHGACNNGIKPARREKLNQEFWDSSLSERYTIGYGTIERRDVKRRKVNRVTSRNNSFIYRLKDETGKWVLVCKVFYLTTLGYTKNNDSFVKLVMGKDNYKISFIAKTFQTRKTSENAKKRSTTHCETYKIIQSSCFPSQTLACAKKTLPAERNHHPDDVQQLPV